MAETRRKFDRDFEEGALRLVRETGGPIAEVARDLVINEGILGNWVNADKRRRGEADGALSEDAHGQIHARAGHTFTRMKNWGNPAGLPPSGRQHLPGYQRHRPPAQPRPLPAELPHSGTGSPSERRRGTAYETQSSTEAASIRTKSSPNGSPLAKRVHGQVRARIRSPSAFRKRSPPAQPAPPGSPQRPSTPPATQRNTRYIPGLLLRDRPWRSRPPTRHKSRWGINR
jgi:hypothetical protein